MARLEVLIGAPDRFNVNPATIAIHTTKDGVAFCPGLEFSAVTGGSDDSHPLFAKLPRFCRPSRPFGGCAAFF